MAREPTTRQSTRMVPPWPPSSVPASTTATLGRSGYSDSEASIAAARRAGSGGGGSAPSAKDPDSLGGPGPCSTRRLFGPTLYGPLLGQ